MKINSENFDIKIILKRFKLCSQEGKERICHSVYFLSYFTALLIKEILNSVFQSHFFLEKNNSILAGVPFFVRKEHFY